MAVSEEGRKEKKRNITPTLDGFAPLVFGFSSTHSLPQTESRSGNAGRLLTGTVSIVTDKIHTDWTLLSKCSSKCSSPAKVWVQSCQVQETLWWGPRDPGGGGNQVNAAVMGRV